MQIQGKNVLNNTVLSSLVNTTIFCTCSKSYDSWSGFIHLLAGIVFIVFNFELKQKKQLLQVKATANACAANKSIQVACINGVIFSCFSGEARQAQSERGAPDARGWGSGAPRSVRAWLSSPEKREKKRLLSKLRPKCPLIPLHQSLIQNFADDWEFSVNVMSEEG